MLVSTFLPVHRATIIFEFQRCRFVACHEGLIHGIIFGSVVSRFMCH